MNPLLMTDGYKTSHHLMYPPNTTLVYSNFTPRSVKYMPEHAKIVVVFGIQYTLKYINDLYNKEFFQKNKEEVIREAKQYLSSYLGSEYDTTHFEKLHDLGYLPLKVKALPEGSKTKEKLPILTIYNTHPDFFWLPNFLETLISSLLWKPLHSASLAYGFKKIGLKYAEETDKENIALVDFLFHDFSFRGMQHPEAAISSGMGFLTSFKGTDTIPALQALKYYYNEDNAGFSVPASEHAVITAYGRENEIDGFRRIINQFPKGIVSVVSDSFDLWKVLTKFLPKMKQEILSRDGKVVIRPDSGDPVDIICGKECKKDEKGYYIEIQHAGPGTWDNKQIFSKSYLKNQSEAKGVIELLWDVFGGTINEQGYKVLDSHIGMIYGDSITLDRTIQINERLKAKGFASTNWVAGVGSFSLGFSSRDSQGCAVKAVYCEVNGEGREIFKDPITDDGVKKSAKGLLAVFKDEQGKFYLKDQCTWEEEKTGELIPVFENGKLLVDYSLSEIRERLNHVSN